MAKVSRRKFNFIATSVSFRAPPVITSTCKCSRTGTKDDDGTVTEKNFIEIFFQFHAATRKLELLSYASSKSLSVPQLFRFSSRCDSR